MTYFKKILAIGLLTIVAACAGTGGGQIAGSGQSEYIYNDDSFYDYVDRY